MTSVAAGTSANELAGASAAPARSWRFRIAGWLPLVPALAVTGFFFIYPLVSGLIETFQDEAGKLTFSRYQALATDSALFSTTFKTFAVSLPVTTFCLLVAVPLAHWMRRGPRFEKLISGVLILPMTLGTVLVSLGMLSYFGRQGWFNQALVGLHLTKPGNPLALTYNFAGVEIGLFIQSFPLMFLTILGFMSGIDPSLERSAKMLGANSWQTFFRVILPLSIPGIITAASLGFVANFSAFPTAVLVGQPMGETRTLAIAAYEAAFEYYDFAKGNIIALLMGGIQLAVVGLLMAARRTSYRGQAGVKG